MTQEEKQLLLKDLCARIPYGVKCKVNFDDGTSDVMKLSQFPDGLGMWGFCKDGCYGRTDDFKPYLRSMSSMTEEEAIKYITLTHYNTDDNGKPYRELTINALDWLNEHHFDYRGLIEKRGRFEEGLAFEAPEGMYKTE